MGKNIDTKAKATLSLDLDNMWSYLKTHGDKEWETYPSYLEIVVPRILNVLEQHDLKITFFIVGKDAELEKNHEVIRSIFAAGHEIGNHSYNHEPWLPSYPEEAIESEIALTEEIIEGITGKKPIGFRGPGYCLSIPILKALARRGYLYDASTLPTFLGPLARLYFFMTSKLKPEEKETRKELFGGIQDGLRPIRTYRIRIQDNGGHLFEIPVTTMPFFRIPFHVSYLLYISRFSPFFARLYFRIALSLCRLVHVQPSLLLHPLDFLGCDDFHELDFFPAMDKRSDRKIKMVEEFLHIYYTRFEVHPIGEFIESLLQEDNIKSVELTFSTKRSSPAG